MRATCTMSPNGRRIQVHFGYDPAAVEAIRAVPGRSFHDIEQNGQRMKFWTIPADITSARRLREEFGDFLELDDSVIQWGREAIRTEANLKSLVNADDAKLENISSEKQDWLRPYQRADVAMMAAANVINANQPGVGKTVETIYAIIEAKLPGPHLIVCPTSLFKDPWRDELRDHYPDARVLYGDSPDGRRAAVWELSKMVDPAKTFLLLNPEMVRVAKLGPDDPPVNKDGAPVTILSKDHKGNAYVPKDETGELLFRIQWGALVTDEFHKFGLGGDRNTQFARGLFSLRKNCKRAYALSGTPIGGKPIRLWGVLNFIEPDKFSSKWRWAEQWLEIDDSGYGKKIGGLIPGRDQAFADAHAAHMVRRIRSDALPGLPAKVTINVETPMTKKQRKVYDEMILAAEVELEGGRVSATGQLAEYARLKQFANALCEVVDGKVEPTMESGKLPVLLDRLDTYGIRKEDPEPNARAIVASESARFVVLLESYLGSQGLNVRRLDGSVTNKKGNAARDEVIDWYKEESQDARVLVMTTQTGGVGLNLGMTGSIHIMDETWNPDDQEQLEDRGMRNRTTPLNVLYYRTENSIQQYIWEITAGKAVNNKNIVDVRKLLKEKLKARSGA